MHQSLRSSDSSHRFLLYPRQERHEMVHTSHWMLALTMPYEVPQVRAVLDGGRVLGQTRRHVEPCQRA